MPAHGDQHKANGATTANPFEEQKSHISEYTAQEIATLQCRLNKRLGPEFISTRPGPGNQKIAYLSAEKAINLANEVFGFNGWSTSIQNIQIDFVDENQQTGKVSLGLSVVVRVTLKDGTFHEDIGYGGIDNCKGKAMAFEKSKKEATTDALKRALRNFGNVLGNCVYDKDYITRIAKVKAGNGRFDVSELHRHPDFAPKVTEEVKSIIQPAAPTSNTPSLEHEESFDVSEFDDFDFTESDLAHPEEVLLPGDSGSSNQHFGVRPGASMMNTPSKPPQLRQQAAHQPGQNRMPGQQPGSHNPATNYPQRNGTTSNRPPQAARIDSANSDDKQSSSPGVQSMHFAIQQGQTGLPAGAPPNGNAGFYSARATQSLAEKDISVLNSLPPSNARFNPHAESPSIRKTAGLDHSKSVPVRREIQKPDMNAPPNIVDPRGDPNRRVGMAGQAMPGPTARPGMSTSAYRPPCRHNVSTISNTGSGPVAPAGVAGGGLPSAKRPPLSDLSNVQHNVTAVTTDGADAKRQKVGSNAGHSTDRENTPHTNGVPEA